MTKPDETIVEIDMDNLSPPSPSVGSGLGMSFAQVEDEEDDSHNSSSNDDESGNQEGTGDDVQGATVSEITEARDSENDEEPERPSYFDDISNAAPEDSDETMYLGKESREFKREDFIRESAGSIRLITTWIGKQR